MFEEEGSHTGQGARRAGELDNLIGARLRARRLLVKLKQHQVANRVGISPQQYFKYEAGISRLTVARLIAIADVMGAPVASFLEGLGSHTETGGIYGDLLADPDCVEMLAILQSCKTAYARAGILAIARQLADFEDGIAEQSA